MDSRKEKILVRGVNWLGDAVMSTPALMRLREAKPRAQIVLLTPHKLGELWEGYSAVDEVMSFTRAEGVGALTRRLREREFDVALILPNSFRSAFESWLAGIPARIGYGGRGRKLLLTRVVGRPKQHVPMLKRSGAEVKRLTTEVPERARESFPISAHHLHHYLWLAAALRAKTDPLAPALAVKSQERERFRAEFELPGDVRTIIGLNPGAEYGPAKRWPVDRFIETAVQLERLFHPVWIIFGGLPDLKTATRIEQGVRRSTPNARIVNAAARTSLRELCAGLSLCDVVLTNDTGPMHLAAAVGSRVVVPFGSTSPELTGPGLPGNTGHALISGRASCAPCFLRVCPVDFRCMSSISVGEIVQAISRLLRR